MEISFDYLIDNQIMEYIAPEEQENCLICDDIAVLYENEKNPIKRFTHLDIPQAIIGIAGLTSPLANHNQVARVVFQTGQSKQTCGWPCLNWPFKTYKDMHLQIYNEMPLAKTFVNKYISPVGANAIVAVAIYTGFNQEDSIIVNQSAADRGLFTTSYFTYEKTELDKSEEFMTPIPTETEDMKAYSNYEKLVNGLITIGTYVENGDVIIGKVSRINKNNIKNGILYSDHSIVYKRKEPSYIWDVIISRNEDSNKVCKIVFRSIRKCAIGDKFSQRSGLSRFWPLKGNSKCLPSETKYMSVLTNIC
jgi:DNA-directed RNA polymerase beta subunit